MSAASLPVGKLPSHILVNLLSQIPCDDPDVLQGPGIGLDCAVIEVGDSILVFKSDPITFAAEDIAWYLVQINANDIATCGATPRWLLVTILLPEESTTREQVHSLWAQLSDACREIGVCIVGGHTEITHGLDRPILVGTLVGQTERSQLVTPGALRPGDHLLLTKGVPIETVAILAREFPQRLTDVLSPMELDRARNFLTDPGISVLRDAQIATSAGRVTAMHDPTEGGIVAALWELSEASGRRLLVDTGKIPVLPLADRICRVFDLDPLATIASGALLLTVHPEDSGSVIMALRDSGIACQRIGRVGTSETGVVNQTRNGPVLLTRPERDEIAVLFER